VQNSHPTDGRKPYKTYKAKGARRTPRDEEFAAAQSPRRPQTDDDSMRSSGYGAASRNPSRPAPEGSPSAPYRRYAANEAERHGPRPADGGAATYRRYAADEPGAGRQGGPPQPPAKGPKAPRRRRRRRLWTVPVALVLLLAIAAIVGVVLAWPGYQQFDAAVDESNARLNDTTQSQLSADDGLMVRSGTTVLLLGVDSWNGQPGRSDTIMLMRFNPDTGTINQLSIPRDTRVQLPNGTYDKINAATFWGGSAMAVETVENYLGIDVNHVMVVNFKGFRQLVNSIGGVDIYVPKTISTVAGKDQHAVTFEKGMNHMSGSTAMLYVRVRYADDDLHRAARQQQFIQALQKKLVSPSNLRKLPQIGSDFMGGVATDLTTNEILALSYLKWRSDGGKKAVMPGTPGWEGGVSYIFPPSEAEKQEIVKEFLTH